MEALQFTGNDVIQELGNFVGAKNFHMFYVQNEKAGLCLNLGNNTHILMEPEQWVFKTSDNSIGFDVSDAQPN